MGLRRTTDGGQTWTDVSPSDTGTHFFQDLKVFEGDFNVQYTFNTSDDNIYKSTDGGAIWISQGEFPDVENIFDDGIERAELAIFKN